MQVARERHPCHRSIGRIAIGIALSSSQIDAVDDDSARLCEDAPK